MDIIKDKVDEMIIKTGYTCQEAYSDKQLNTLRGHWLFFDEKEKDIQELFEVSLETVLYTKYYWCTQFKNRFSDLYGKDAGIEQQQ